MRSEKGGQKKGGGRRVPSHLSLLTAHRRTTSETPPRGVPLDRRHHLPEQRQRRPAAGANPAGARRVQPQARRPLPAARPRALRHHGRVPPAGRRADRRDAGGDRPHHQHRIRTEPRGPRASAPAGRHRARERPGVSGQCLSLAAAQGQRHHARAGAHHREGWPDEARLLERLGDPRVRVLAVSLVQFSNGYTVDLARLSAATRAAGTYLVVDAIQGVGQLPVDLRKTPVDVLACGGQKWLLSPWGSGFVYVRRELIRELSPSVTGWMAFEGTDDFTRLTEYRDTLRGDARRFELITLPYQDFAGMNASVGLLLESASSASPSTSRRCMLRCWPGRRGAGVRVVSPVGEQWLGHPLRAPADVGSASGAQGGSGHLQHAGGRHPAQPAPVQHGGGDGAGGRHTGAGMTAFTDMLAAGYGYRGAVAGARRSARGNPGPPGAQDSASARDGEPPRAGRRRHRHRQDQDASAAHRTALGSGRAGVRGRHEGRPLRPRRAGRARDRVTGRAGEIGWDWKAARRAGRVRQPHRCAGGAAPCHGQLVRAAAAGQGALAERHPDQRPDDGLQVRRRQSASAARLPRSPGGAPVPLLGRWQAGPRPVRRHVRGLRWACCCGRWWSSSPRAPSGSSASPSST